MSSSTVQVLWHLRAAALPAVRRPCPRCDQTTSFHCTERFRVNGHGRRLDVWLLYACARCEHTWKHTLHTRVRADRLGVQLRAYEADDPATLRRHAFDGAALARDGCAVQPVPYTLLGPVGAPPTPARLHLRWDPWFPVRLDRVLGHGLDASRSAVQRWVRQGVLELPGGRRDLARPAREGVVLIWRGLEQEVSATSARSGPRRGRTSR